MARNTALQTDQNNLDRRSDPGIAQSLCLTCAHQDGCALRVDGTVIRFCEEFLVEPSPTPRAFPREVRADEPVDTAQGLCADCAHAEGCAHRTTAEGGVWYCEEYR